MDEPCISEPHPEQQPLPPELERIWIDAVHDAELVPAHTILILQQGDQSVDGQYATYMARSRDIDAPVPPDLLDRLNSDSCVHAHRIVLWTGDRPIEVQAAILRHELEHARQHDADSDLTNVHDLASAVVSFAEVDSGRLYNQIPMERHANAASALFTRRTFGRDRIDELVAATYYSALLKEPASPPSTAGLMQQMLEFLAQYPHLCRQVVGFKEWLGPERYRIWHALLSAD